jgi:hypothetical protein
MAIQPTIRGQQVISEYLMDAGFEQSTEFDNVLLRGPVTVRWVDEGGDDIRWEIHVYTNATRYINAWEASFSLGTPPEIIIATIEKAIS